MTKQKRRRVVHPTWNEIKKYVEGRMHEHRRLLNAECGVQCKRISTPSTGASDAGAEIVQALSDWRETVDERLDALERGDG